jgi:hypothetical protein
MRGEVGHMLAAQPLELPNLPLNYPKLSTPSLHLEERSYEGQWLTYNLLQVCHLHVGQAGTQLGNSAWELYVHPVLHRLFH